MNNIEKMEQERKLEREYQHTLDVMARIVVEIQKDKTMPMSSIKSAAITIFHIAENATKEIIGGRHA